MLGKEVATIVNENLNPGTYKYKFDGSNLSSGIYFYKLVVSVTNPLVVCSSNQLVTNDFTAVKRMVLLK